ncbi:MAG: hypothetical protein IJS32_03840, partial [Kiritimatiellae bacterium]|nr:hypothetical protein [Kiritimatiellia bacterium]
MANLESESKSAVNIVAKTLRVKAERGYGWAEGVSPVCTKGDWVKRQHTPICRWEQPGMFYIEKHENRFADWKTLELYRVCPECRSVKDDSLEKRLAARNTEGTEEGGTEGFWRWSLPEGATLRKHI